jgi:DNA-directed RNA polymerase II subunit RPB9
MLYPRESLANDKLVFACRTCDFVEEATAHCIYRNHLYNTAGETAGVTQDVGADPTVSAIFIPDYECSFCSGSMCCCICEAICEDDVDEDGLTIVLDSNDDEDVKADYSPLMDSVLTWIVH